jgi:hypothetical protein
MQYLETQNKLIFTIIIITTTFTLYNILYFAWADETIPIVSTRGHFDKLTGDLISTQPYNPLDNEILNSICMRNEEVVVYVHGVWTTERDLLENSVENADEIFERLNMSIKDAGYNYPVVGFSWDSDTTIDIEGEGWNIVVGIQILL